jgi:hypothetical protein
MENFNDVLCEKLHWEKTEINYMKNVIIFYAPARREVNDERMKSKKKKPTSQQ